MSIHLQGIRKRFGNFTALDDISLSIETGSLTALVGPSGSGKTTLLRIIAGLEDPDSGRVDYDGADFTHRSARERNVGFVFQHYALFRHMSVFENIAFALRVRKVSKHEVHRRVSELLSLVRLESLGNRYPTQLSGGQRQRVALARALAAQPKILLLDEPFGALDAKVREELRQWLEQLHRRIQMTTVLVTHDQEEALEVADDVVVMNQGRIEQVGTPDDVFNHPANPFVMHFLGRVNVFYARVANGRASLGGLELDCPALADADGKAAVYVRPHDFDIEHAAGSSPRLAARIERVHAAGRVAKVYAVSPDFGVGLHVELSAERFAELKLSAGETVFVVPRKARVFAGGLPEYSI